jgi:hypothetical protein
MRIDRNSTVDVCRGLLFILMVNTHALTIAGVSRTSWLFSDFWLPNGWATVVFVVLSGYGVGLIYSVRKSIAESVGAMRRRGSTILSVMVVSNVFFAAIKQFSEGNLAALANLQWWLGFITLETQWTISGVLLPTAMVLFFGSTVIQFVKSAPWLTLLGLVFTRIALSIFDIELMASTYATSWAARIFFLEGLGGYPLLPFMVNGFIGIWLGAQYHRNRSVWLRSMVVFLIIQAVVYALPAGTLAPFIKIALVSVSAVGKFAWVFGSAYVLATVLQLKISLPVQLIGHYALGSFVAHRVFLQSIGIAIGAIGLSILSPETRYVLLFLGTLFSIWALCILRIRHASLGHVLARLGL